MVCPYPETKRLDRVRGIIPDWSLQPYFYFTHVTHKYMHERECISHGNSLLNVCCVSVLLWKSNCCNFLGNDMPHELRGFPCKTPIETLQKHSPFHRERYTRTHTHMHAHTRTHARTHAHTSTQWRAQASRQAVTWHYEGTITDRGGHDSLSCWFFYFEAVWASQPN